MNSTELPPDYAILQQQGQIESETAERQIAKEFDEMKKQETKTELQVPPHNCVCEVCKRDDFNDRLSELDTLPTRLEAVEKVLAAYKQAIHTVGISCVAEGVFGIEEDINREHKKNLATAEALNGEG